MGQDLFGAQYQELLPSEEDDIFAAPPGNKDLLFLQLLVKRGSKDIDFPLKYPTRLYSISRFRELVPEQNTQIQVEKHEDQVLHAVSGILTASAWA
jgi:hypothetical protein